MKYRFIFRTSQENELLLKFYAEKSDISLNKALNQLFNTHPEIVQLDFELNCIWETDL